MGLANRLAQHRLFYGGAVKVRSTFGYDVYFQYPGAMFVGGVSDGDDRVRGRPWDGALLRGIVPRILTGL